MMSRLESHGKDLFKLSQQRKGSGRSLDKLDSIKENNDDDDFYEESDGYTEGSPSYVSLPNNEIPKLNIKEKTGSALEREEKKVSERKKKQKKSITKKKETL